MPASLFVEGGRAILLVALGALAFLSGVALLGRKGLGSSEFPPVETGLTDGELAFRQHGGGHTTGPNWPTFLTFADRYIKGPSRPAAAKP